MKKVFRWALLSLAVLGTVIAFANNNSPDVREPIVVVSPSEAVVSPYTEFMMTILYRFTRKVFIVAPENNYFEYEMEEENAYIPEIRHFNYLSIINAPHTSVTYEITALNNGFYSRTNAYYSSTGLEI